MIQTATPHPAKFTDSLLPVIARYLKGYHRVLDPMAGVGTLGRYLQPYFDAIATSPTYRRHRLAPTNLVFDKPEDA